MVWFHQQGADRDGYLALRELITRYGWNRLWRGKTFRTYTLDGLDYWVIWPVINRDDCGEPDGAAALGVCLGLDPTGTALVELEQEWASWLAQFPQLARAGDIRSLRDWLAAASPAEADNVLHALATLGSPSGGDNLAAALVLAWALLPGGCALAHRLRALSPRIDEMVAAQLWLEIRSFPWRRLRKVAGNILANTRAGVLREFGVRSQLERTDRAWSMTRLVDPSASFWARLADGLDTVPSAGEELVELLEFARAANVITDADEKLLLLLVEVADRCGTTRISRGSAGLMSNAASAQVAIQVGLSPITVRRRARRLIDALAAAQLGQQAA